MRRPVDITDAEWLLMLVLWDRGSATAADIIAAAQRDRDVSPQTVKTLLRRLVDKRAVGYAIDPDDSRVYHYRPLIGKEEAVMRKSEDFVSRVYRNNAGDLLAHFVESDKLSREELLRLRGMVEKKLNGETP